MGNDDLLPADDEDDAEDQRLITEQPTVDAADKQTIKKQEQRIARERAEIELFWKHTLADPIGRREIWKILDFWHHTFKAEFSITAAGFPDPNATWYLRGIQDNGLRLYHMLLAIDPAGTLLMHQENDIRFAKPQPKPRRRTDG